MAHTIDRSNIEAAARILALHALGVRHLMDEGGDDAPVDLPGLEVLWGATWALVGDDVNVWGEAFDLSIEWFG